MQTLVVGDIHGCFYEFQELLSKAGVAEDDPIVAVGDILDRGPGAIEVLEFFQTHPNARTIMGNHERKHLRESHGETEPALSQLITKEVLGEERYLSALQLMQPLPLFLELPEAVIFHGFFEPGIAIEEQKETVIVGTMSGETYLKKNYSSPWYELYEGEKPALVGHRDYLDSGEGFNYQDRVFGLDTGAYRGGPLTGLLLPEFRFVSVPSRENYWAKAKREYGWLLQ
jgi:serine/threonine protein phosphatase 1